MSELVPGGNMPLPGGALTLRVGGPFDVSALVTDASGKVSGDADFVFYNQPSAPGARLSGETLTLDPGGLRAGAERVTVVVSPADPGVPLNRLPAPVLEVTAPGGRRIARFAPPRPQQETVLLIAEISRRGPGWKLRALGQGYAEGLAGIARDFGVDVVEDAGPPPAAPSPVRRPVTGAPAPGSGPRRPSGIGARLLPGLGTRLSSGLGTRSSSGLGAHPVPGAATGHAYGFPGDGDPAAHPGGGAMDGFLDLVNSARMRAGSGPVSFDARLTEAAKAHAATMADRGRLGSESPDGTSVFQRVTATGYAYITVGEHLVSGPRTPAEFVEYCLSTEQARHTLQDPAVTQTGVGHITDRRSGDVFWTALWARPFSPAELSRTAQEVVGLTNAERSRAGLPPLAVDALLTAAAQAHSTDMVVRAFYSHTSPDGSEPWDRAAAAGSTRRTIGENIACGQRSPAEVVDGWMNSPGHRANILKPAFTHIGIGFAGGGKAGTYWTQLFGA
ncbi:CAP domain-containing protein [Streptomyces cavernae]|uniref:CAP domain-containing protein n=1 Tax=Streptomyces cavernae TaxID=2259034 RepID=UPI000FEB81F4|nr:CAP domain-containing protein [Streptomyces cavernae]